MIAFDPTDGPTDGEFNEVNIRLTPAGGERDREDLIRIIDATVLSADTQEFTITDGVLSLTPDTNQRVQLRIVADSELDGYALRIG